VKTRNKLEDVEIASPCQASWEDMQGDERVRFCGLCRLNVYNLSGMTRNEGEAFLQKCEGRVCVRMFRRADGTVLTEDCPWSFTVLKRKVTVAAAGFVALLSLGLGGLLGWRDGGPRDSADKPLHAKDDPRLHEEKGDMVMGRRR
jgi:hypothetical protein